MKPIRYRILSSAGVLACLSLAAGAFAVSAEHTTLRSLKLDPVAVGEDSGTIAVTLATSEPVLLHGILLRTEGVGQTETLKLVGYSIDGLYNRRFEVPLDIAPAAKFKPPVVKDLQSALTEARDKGLGTSTAFIDLANRVQDLLPAREGDVALNLFDLYRDHSPHFAREVYYANMQWVNTAAEAEAQAQAFVAAIATAVADARAAAAAAAQATARAEAAAAAYAEAASIAIAVAGALANAEATAEAQAAAEAAAQLQARISAIIEASAAAGAYAEAAASSNAEAGAYVGISAEISQTKTSITVAAEAGSHASSSAESSTSAVASLEAVLSSFVSLEASLSAVAAAGAGTSAEAQAEAISVAIAAAAAEAAAASVAVATAKSAAAAAAASAATATAAAAAAAAAVAFVEVSAQVSVLMTQYLQIYAAYRDTMTSPIPAEFAITLHFETGVSDGYTLHVKEIIETADFGAMELYVGDPPEKPLDSPIVRHNGFQVK